MPSPLSLKVSTNSFQFLILIWNKDLSNVWCFKNVFYFHLLHLVLYFKNLSYLWCHIELIKTYPNLKLDFANFLAIFYYECSQWAILERLSQYLINIKWKRTLVSQNSSNWNRVSVAKRKLTFQLSLEVGTDERVLKLLLIKTTLGRMRTVCSKIVKKLT